VVPSRSGPPSQTAEADGVTPGLQALLPRSRFARSVGGRNYPAPWAQPRPSAPTKPARCRERLL